VQFVYFVVSFAFFVFVLFVPLVVKKELRGEGALRGGQPLQIGCGDGDLPAEAGVLPDVLQFGGVLRIGVQQCLDPPPIGERPIVIFFRPDCGSFHNQRFAIGIEFVGHDDWGLEIGGWGLGKTQFRRRTCAACSPSSSITAAYRAGLFDSILASRRGGSGVGQAFQPDKGQRQFMSGWKA
jgi:hypothetical protein